MVYGVQGIEQSDSQGPAGEIFIVHMKLTISSFKRSSSSFIISLQNSIIFMISTCYS